MDRKVSKKFRKMMPIYSFFAKWNFQQKIFDNKLNGFAVGKRWLNLMVTMWKNYIKEGILFKEELYNDLPTEMHCWLEKVLKDIPVTEERRDLT